MSSTARPGPVLLGLRDAAIETGSHCSWETSKAGGRPDCVPGITMQYPHCPCCSDRLIHIVQVYCPLEGSAYHRTINVLACFRPECWGRSDSWKVLRSQCLETPHNPEVTTKTAPVPVTVKAWCLDADDWGMDDTLGSNTKDLVQTPDPVSEQGVREQTTRLEALCLLEEPEGQGLVSESPVPQFQPFYISVVEEEDSQSQSSFSHEQELLLEYQRREGVCVEQLPVSSCEGPPETYEKCKVQHGDTTFAKFMKRISSCPQQILRYCWNGSPLLLSSPPLGLESATAACELCASPRVFEFQLMPALVNMLKSSSSQEWTVEFGTVLIYTCRRSCWTPTSHTPVEEHAFVQADPDQHFFNRH
ncbi:programmed cell death protein 2-like [Stegostoma tigrinum]|uniref:programmed cell death protein 2-like n=1 Tax=Stegostoma tigrinum TaxID=3053191 RepID=UPI00202B66F9|nr:programmed cell death protein 2-like [Stegostoma tigrinum]